MDGTQSKIVHVLWRKASTQVYKLDVIFRPCLQVGLLCHSFPPVIIGMSLGLSDIADTALQVQRDESRFGRDPQYRPTPFNNRGSSSKPSDGPAAYEQEHFLISYTLEYVIELRTDK